MKIGIGHFTCLSCVCVGFQWHAGYFRWIGVCNWLWMCFCVYGVTHLSPNACWTHWAGMINWWQLNALLDCSRPKITSPWQTIIVLQGHSSNIEISLKVYWRFWATRQSAAGLSKLYWTYDLRNSQLWKSSISFVAPCWSLRSRHSVLSFTVTTIEEALQTNQAWSDYHH